MNQEQFQKETLSQMKDVSVKLGKIEVHLEHGNDNFKRISKFLEEQPRECNTRFGKIESDIILLLERGKKKLNGSGKAQEKGMGFWTLVVSVAIAFFTGIIGMVVALLKSNHN